MLLSAGAAASSAAEYPTRDETLQGSGEADEQQELEQQEPSRSAIRA
jgi:hypothetical protein